MSTKQTLLALGAALIIGLAIGRFTLPAKVITKTETVEVEKKQSDTTIDKQDHSVVTRTETKNADGSVTVVTRTEKNVVTDTDRKSTTEDTKHASSETTKIYDTSRLTLSALLAINPLNHTQPMYGASVSYRILGPFSIGAFGLTDGLAGVSLGITF